MAPTRLNTTAVEFFHPGLSRDAAFHRVVLLTCCQATSLTTFRQMLRLLLLTQTFLETFVTIEDELFHKKSVKTFPLFWGAKMIKKQKQNKNRSKKIDLFFFFLLRKHDFAPSSGEGSGGDGF